MHAVFRLHPSLKGVKLYDGLMDDPEVTIEGRIWYEPTLLVKNAVGTTWLKGRAFFPQLCSLNMCKRDSCDPGSSRIQCIRR